MSFSDIPKIESTKFYIDVAMRRAKKRVGDSIQQISKKDFLVYKKKIARKKVTVFSDVMREQFLRIVTSFPSLDDLTEYYAKLVRLTLEFGDVKKALGSLPWAVTKISGFARIYDRKIYAARSEEDVGKHQSEFIGRATSIIKQIKSNLELLDEARKIMRGYPTIKSGMYTVCIAGFPNVGKSTLLSKITPARPEIKNYAFTTKGINAGYITTPGVKVQLLDTPGTLNRIDAMNAVEQQAYLAMRYVADIMVYVFDLTETSYPLADQEKLFEKIVRLKKPMLIYLSKTDVLTPVSVEEFLKEREAIISPDILKEKLLVLAKKAETV
ncbi:MAG: nucleolar GTP-binding protein [Candidatus Woesearchaeota archaeon]|jgi:nucleolar GTP-binding protein